MTHVSLPAIASLVGATRALQPAFVAGNSPGQTLGNRANFAVGLLERHARLQTADDRVAAIIAAAGRRIRRDRHPDVGERQVSELD